MTTSRSSESISSRLGSANASTSNVRAELERVVAAIAGTGEQWIGREALPLAILRVGDMQLACDPAAITMIIPLPQRFPSCPGMLDVAEGLGITLPEDDPFFGAQAVVPTSRAWQQLELLGGEVEVVVPEPPAVQPVPRACIQRLPALLSDPSRPYGSAVPGLLGLICDAPGLAPIVWLADLPRFAKLMLASLGYDESA